MVRKFARVTNRVESGAIQFGDDWPGLFLRGDESKYLSMSIQYVLEALKANTDISAKLALMHLEGVKKTIDEEVVQGDKNA